ncbi:MAG: hypothetical protein ACLU8F_04630 [Clostridia bacterium]
MAVVTFWSNNQEETGKTLSIAAVATHLAIEHNYKILLVSTSFCDDTLESCFWDLNNTAQAKIGLFTKKKPITTALSSGIEGLAKAMVTNRVTPETLKDYTKTVFKNRLDVLFGFLEKNREEYERVKPLYPDVIKNANQYYDIVLVDLNKGLEDPDARKILEMSDVIVDSITQKMKTINQLIALLEKEPLLRRGNLILAIGRYDRFSKYSAKNVARYVKRKEGFCTIPYNTLFFEACGEGKIVDFFLKLRKIDENDRNKLFMDEIKRLSDEIIYKIQEAQMKM